MPEGQARMRKRAGPSTQYRRGIQYDTECTAPGGTKRTKQNQTTILHDELDKLARGDPNFLALHFRQC